MISTPFNGKKPKLLDADQSSPKRRFLSLQDKIDIINKKEKTQCTDESLSSIYKCYVYFLNKWPNWALTWTCPTSGFAPDIARQNVVQRSRFYCTVIFIENWRKEIAFASDMVQFEIQKGLSSDRTFGWLFCEWVDCRDLAALRGVLELDVAQVEL